MAAWAGESIDLGLGCGYMRPIVLGPAAVPEITDPSVAEQEIELAVLSAVAHGNEPNGLAVLEAALVALGRLDREHAVVYFQVIWSVLREPVQRALEAVVMERQTENKRTLLPIEEELVRWVRSAEAARAVLTVLRVRGVAVPEEARVRILAQKDLDRLERLLEKAAVASSVAEVLDDPS